MQDFETMPRGTTEELARLRDAIKFALKQPETPDFIKARLRFALGVK